MTLIWSGTFNVVFLNVLEKSRKWQDHGITQTPHYADTPLIVG